MTADFRKYLSEHFDPFLKPAGFKRRAYTFAKWAHNNGEIIEFQTWKERTSFTVNLAIFSSRIWHYEGPGKPVPAFPLASDSPWWTRLGALVPGSKDRWWPLPESDDFGPQGEEVRILLKEHAIPTLDKFHTDEALRDFWLGGNSMGTSAARRDFYLIILLAEIGPDDMFQKFLAQYRDGKTGTPFDSLSESDIEMILRQRRQPVIPDENRGT